MPRPGIGTTAATRRLRQLVSAVSIKKTGGMPVSRPREGQVLFAAAKWVRPLRRRFLLDSAARAVRRQVPQRRTDCRADAGRTVRQFFLSNVPSAKKRREANRSLPFSPPRTFGRLRSQTKVRNNPEKTGRTAQPPHVRFLTCTECRASGFFYLFRINGAKPAYSSASASFALPVSGSYRYW